MWISRRATMSALPVPIAPAASFATACAARWRCLSSPAGCGRTTTSPAAPATQGRPDGFLRVMAAASRRPVGNALDALVPGAMGAAVGLALRLDAVADDAAVAMGTARGHGVDGAFEAVESHGAAALGDAQGLVVVVAADVAGRHRALLAAIGLPVQRPAVAKVPAG